MVQTAALAVFALVLLYNAARHDPTVGYDAGGHLDNMRALARGRIPTSADSHEYWSPPLPYLLPALALASGLLGDMGAAKFGQFVNAALAIFMVLLLMRLARRARPGDPWAPALAMLFLAMLPVIYKTFAFVRGEPYLAALGVAVAAVYLGRLVARAEEGSAPSFDWRAGALAGALLGMIALSRQWGFMLFPAVAAFAGVEWARGRIGWRPALGMTALSFTIAFIVGGWFYLLLWHRHGTPTPFSMNRAESLRLSNQPAAFYFGVSAEPLFNDPVRPAFINRLTPIFYAETWGDYWCYFLVWGRDGRTGARIAGAGLEPQWHDDSRDGELPGWMETNRRGMGRYLGRVNTAALLPTALLLLGLAAGARRWWRWLAGHEVTEANRTAALAFMIVAASLAGYLYFLLMFPKPQEGDTIKASYMLQIYPFAALLAGMTLAEWRERRPEIFWAALTALLLVFLHNLPACLTRYTF